MRTASINFLESTVPPDVGTSRHSSFEAAGGPDGLDGHHEPDGGLGAGLQSKKFPMGPKHGPLLSLKGSEPWAPV